MVAEHLYWLNQIRPDVRAWVGDKAFYLGLADQRGYPVIPGFVVSAQLFQEFLTQIDWLEPLFADLPHSFLHVNVDNPMQLQTIAQQIQHSIRTTLFPPEWVAALEAECLALPSNYLICRPSIAVKDSSDLALSLKIRGLLSAYVCQAEPMAIAQTIQQVWASLFQARSLLFWQRAKVPLHQLRLGVLVQPLYPALASGTVHHYADSLEIQACWGMGLAIKTGEVIPDRYRLFTTSGNIYAREAGKKPYAYSLKGVHSDIWAPTNSDYSLSELARTSPILALYAVDESHQDDFTLSEAVLKQLTQINGAIAQDLGIQTSLEWSLGASLFPTQRASLRYGPIEADGQWLYLTQLLPQPVGELLDDNERDSHRAREKRHVAESSDRPTSTMPMPPPQVASSAAPSMIHNAIHHTVVHNNDEQEHSSQAPLEPSAPVSYATLLKTALGASPGQVVAPAWIVSDTDPQAVAQLPMGYILVAPSITPDWLLDIRRSAGLVSEQGGMTSHAAIIARELGIPAVVGASEVTRTLRTGDTLLINGDRGTIYRVETGRSPRPVSRDMLATLTSQPSSSLSDRLSDDPSEVLQFDESPLDGRSLDRGQSFDGQSFDEQSDIASLESELASNNTRLFRDAAQMLNRIIGSDRPNATQLMVSLSQPQKLPDLSHLPIDGIGLLRSELLIPAVLNQTLLSEWLATGQEDDLVHRLAAHVQPFVEAVHPYPVYYRSLDLRTQEFEHILGDRPLSSEPNPLLGCHGTLSYLQNATVFQLELRALHQLHQAGYQNLHLILPFVRTVEEFTACRHFILNTGLVSLQEMQLWIMAEVPSVLFLLPEYVDAGISGIAIGTNDLTQLMLAIDRNHPPLSHAFNQRHPSVLRAIKHLIQSAQRLNVPCSVCGEAPSLYPDVVKQLVHWGATSVTVSPNAVMQTYRAIAQAEKEVVLEGLRHLQQSE